MRWDSPLVLALAGTAALHLVVITAGDALVVTHPPRPWVAAPHVELVEIEVPPEIKPLPPPPPAAAPPPPVEPVAPRPAPRAPPRQAARAVASPPRAPEPPPNPSEPAPPSGGEPVVHMDDVAPAATGVAVAVGKPVTGRIGRGGSGGGTGAGTGSGTGNEVAPASIATIKIDAQPKGDYSYSGIGKEYPAEAIALGIEGDIRVQMVIDVNGKVASRRLLNRLGHGLDEIAMKRAAEMEFTPAIDSEGHVVPQRIVWTFHMTLPK